MPLRRITIMLDDVIEKKIRRKQARKIMETRKSYSFSAAVNDALRGKLK